MKEKWFTDDGKVIRQKTTDPNPALDSAKALRSNDKTTMFGGKESWHVARVDAHVLEQWVKEAGLRFDDREAVRDLIKRKLLDGDNAAFRVHEGTW
jgi:hypothetical protein